MFGFIASARVAWKRRRAGFLAPLLVLIAAIRAARVSARLRALRKFGDPPAEKLPAMRRRPMKMRYTAHMRRLAAKRRLERFGLDELDSKGKPLANNIRLMRNARKAERIAP